MLAGIKTGKKKKSKTTRTLVEAIGKTGDNIGGDQRTELRRPELLLSGNEAVAATLRQGLLSSSICTTASTILHARAATTIMPSQSRNATIILPGDSTMIPGKAEDDMTMAELLVHEKTQMSLTDQETRGILRQKRPRKQPIDSDDEEIQQLRRLQPLPKSSPDQYIPPERRRRQQQQQHDPSRHIAHLRKTEGITQQCWWWVESTRFSESRLLASSSAMTLSLNHPRCLIPGQHLFLTPIPYTPALAVCDETVWSELQQFQQSLRNLAAAQKQAIIFWETVWPQNNNSSTSGGRIWQTRMEALLVPTSVGQDAPLYFRSALAEQAEDWGTHTKLRTISTGLRHAVPPNFGYFYVEYARDHANLQMIESPAFPKDFGTDTIAGMMDLEPLRMKGKQDTGAFLINEQDLKERFLEQYKTFDWTKS